MDMHHYPTDETLASLAASSDDSPVAMLNMNRYRAVAEYPVGSAEAALKLSGREAYLRYGIVAQAAVASVGGKILWATDAQETVIGCDHDTYDEIVVVWYPSRAAFLALSDYPGYTEAHAHRDAAIEQATLVALRADEPVLRNPFEGLL